MKKIDTKTVREREKKNKKIEGGEIERERKR